MGIPGSANLMLLGGGAPAYEIEQSLRFDGSSHLHWTPSSSGNGNSWTVSLWYKYQFPASRPGGIQFFQSDGTNHTNVYTYAQNVSGADGKIYMLLGGGGSPYNRTVSHMRDPSAWYHLVVVYDGADSTVQERQRFYINGVQQPTESPQNPPDGRTSTWMQNVKHKISTDTSEKFYGYMAEFHAVDGQQLLPTDFGEYDDNGVWRPIQYTGSYGTNGFYMKFDPSATNGIGHDHSGNGNNFTASGFTTSGTGTDVMSDTPTKNYATFNPIWPSGLALSDGNLSVSFTNTSSESISVPVTMGATSGKVYVEFKYTASGSGGSCGVGIIDLDTAAEAELAGYESGWTRFIYDQRGVARKNNTNLALNLATTRTAGDILGIAVDCDNGEVRFYVNGTLQYTGTGLSYGRYGFHFEPNIGGSSNTCTVAFNGGQRAFEQTVPTGYKALNSSNLAAPGVADGSAGFNTVLYTGNGSSASDTQAITGVGFQPDLVFIKGRSATSGGFITDAVRGASNRLSPNTQNSEDTSGDWFSSFNTDGFTVKGDANNSNASGETFVAWNWKANGSGSSNTAGSISSTVSANPSAGFSVVTWTGSQADGTVGHGLGVAPSLIIFKRRNATTSWPVYHSGIGPSNLVQLNEYTSQSSSSNSFGSTPTAPTSTVFSVGNNGGTNYGNMVAYCFADVEGFFKVGLYERNGSSDGPCVHLGFTPALILIKEYGAGTESWALYDNKRLGYNPNDYPLFPNTNQTESYLSSTYANEIDFLSNGFKIRTSDSRYNSSLSSYKYLYAAWAVNPFGGSGVSPAPAR